MSVVVMCLLVVLVAGTVLRDGLRDELDQRATRKAPGGRAGTPRRLPRPRRRARPRQERAARPARPVTASAAPPPARRRVRRGRPLPDRHPWRSGMALLASAAGIGLLLGLTLAGVALAAAVLLRSAVDA